MMETDELILTGQYEEYSLRCDYDDFVIEPLNSSCETLRLAQDGTNIGRQNETTPSLATVLEKGNPTGRAFIEMEHHGTPYLVEWTE